ncbi:ribose transport system substrate-binding protein [Pelomonas aquatica]|uniref:Ribose transport system substrate-binding protein n=1 Tax=Pelomonas aquatica TaxID=431058 RepID=A0ABU1Z7U8_9BURK|nr:substrate-binding domain-containing protein [Pelomonas aquatica]MDR7296683.1 ribose transport system substrate-binding protein [Pelomonas aquatica]
MITTCSQPKGAPLSQWLRRSVLALLAAVLATAAAAQGEVAAAASKRVVFLAQDFRNGGITAVYRGFEQACQELGWTLNIVNGNGDRATIRRLFDEALLAGADGIVLGGFDEADIADRLAASTRPAPVLVGWHASSHSGPASSLFANVSTDPAVVADMAAALVTPAGGARAGVVIFNDGRFDIANTKTLRMREALSRCTRCELLAIEDVPISNAAKEMPAALERLHRRFGMRWTHVLAINDVYMDSMHFPLLSLGRRDIVGIAAGDGSRTALSRIRSGRSQQLATIAEPTGLQGWQLADELRRAFAKQPPSGRVARPIVVTTQLLRQLGSQEIDDALPYRAEYRRQWSGTAASSASGR